MTMLGAVSLVLVITLTTSQMSRFLKEDLQGVTLIKDSYPTMKLGSVKFGAGYSTLTHSQTGNSAVEFSQTPGDGSREITQVTYNIELIGKRAEFQSAFMGGGAAAASFMGAPSAQHLTETSTVTALDTLVVATVDAIAGNKAASGPFFKGPFFKGDFQRFVKHYGTHYLHQYTLGGKLVLAMKFSSSSFKEKTDLDTALAGYTGKDITEAEFSTKLTALKNLQIASVQIYVSGSTTPSPQGDIAASIQYALDYSKHIQPTVSEVEYAALWTVSLSKSPGGHAGLANYILQLQTKADTIAGFSVYLLKIHNDAVDMLSMKAGRLAFFSASTWPKIEQIQKESAEKRRDLLNGYRTIAKTPKNLKAIIEKKDENKKSLAGQIEELALKLHKIFSEAITEAKEAGRLPVKK